MTKRNPVSAPQNVWFDTQEVDDTDLTLEQNYNTTIQSGIIANNIGYGVIPGALVPNVLFDSALSNGFLDGVAVSSQNQPSDNNLGNQLAVILTGSQAGGSKTVKVGIIGLDFQSNLQYETFTFRANETQVSVKHFTQILVLLFNDFIGDPDLSFNLGGHLVIQEATPMTLSRDSIMVSQNIQPNLWFRDFFVDSSLSLQGLLQAAMPLYNISTLNIQTQELGQQTLLNGDVTTQIGMKFVASTNNIQKVTFLLSVQNTVIGQQNNLVWNGDLICSIYPLQTTIDCPSDIAPQSTINFSPSNIPIAQVSYNYDSLQAAGVLLDSVPQPIDFIFSNSTIAAGNVLVPGTYYAVTLKRGGAANQCDIQMATGSPTIENVLMTTFTGNLWVDVPEQQLWFEVWNDSAKVSDGQAYENGHGIIIPKVAVDPTTNATVDYSLENLQFVGNDVFRAVLAAITVESDPIPDQRTGEPVDSRQQFEPQVQLLNTIDITNLESASEPMLLGAITDKNIKFYNSLSTPINANLYSATMAEDELLIRVIDDPTDTQRFDTSVIALQSALLNGSFNQAKFYPNSTNPFIFYRVADARLCTYLLGDVNGDGIIDNEDLDLLNSFLGYDMNVGPPLNTLVNTDGYSYAQVVNGYNVLSQPFANQFTVNFYVVDGYGNIVADGYDGVLVADPNDPRLAQFTSASVLFSVIVGLTGYQIFLNTPGMPQNFGIFNIISVESVTDVITLQKVYLTGDSIAQLLRADIDGDFHITFNDGYLLNSYIERVPTTQSQTHTYPAPATNPYTKIGTQFNVIRLRLEQFVDRTDDYSPVTTGRSTAIHVAPDIFKDDGYFAQHNFYTQPVGMSVLQQLSWDDSLIVSNSNPKQVPSVFTSLNGFETNACDIEGISCNVYGSPPAFDKGLVNYFVPDNLIIGQGGEIQRPDGNFYKVDFEVGTIVLEIPDGLFGSERTIDIMSDFIVDYTGGGQTKLGFPAMRFADCSTVPKNALANDQVRFSVSVQSFSPNVNGLSEDGYTGAIVDGKMGVSVDYTTGLLTLNFSNLYQDQVLTTLSTKVQVNVFLKKGGFNNQALFVDSTKVQNMLKLVSVFSGANVGGPSALVDLASDVTDVLPIVHGGTGLNSTGAFGTVLTSNGTSLNYQFVYDLVGVIGFSTGIADANRVPKTDGYGFLDPSFMYKNPVYIYGSAGVFSNDSSTPAAVGALQFNFDNYILEGLDNIKLEVIVESTDGAATAEVQLFNVNTATYITSVSTTNTVATFLQSADIKSSLLNGTTTGNPQVYEIHLKLTGGSGTDTAICKMARLTMTYNNLTLNGSAQIAPPFAHSTNFVPFLPSPTPS